jgi:DNA-binding MarR family transcriptional regulator
MEGHVSALEMSEDELGELFESMSFASRPLRDTAINLTQTYGLGPRGVHILALIDGGADYPIEIAEAFDVSRSLITAELNRLVDAGLIKAQQGQEDRRRTRLSLTGKGKKVRLALRREMQGLFELCALGFTRDEILTCNRVLKAFNSKSRSIRQGSDRNGRVFEKSTPR